MWFSEVADKNENESESETEKAAHKWKVQKAERRLAMKTSAMCRENWWRKVLLNKIERNF